MSANVYANVTERKRLTPWFCLVVFFMLGAHLIEGLASPNVTTTNFHNKLPIQKKDNLVGNLPQPPISPIPVVDYQYDAEGNSTRTTIAPNHSSYNHRTTTIYNSINMPETMIDAMDSETRVTYDGYGRMLKVVDPRYLETKTPRNGFGHKTSLVSPDTGASSMKYDANGNLINRIDSRGVSGAYTYDALNRLTAVVFSRAGETQSFEWNYDQTGTNFSYGIGRLTTASFPEGRMQYAYNGQGNVVQSKLLINAASGANDSQHILKTEYGYDAAGNIININYPSGRKVVFNYEAGLPRSIGFSPTSNGFPIALLSDIGYAPFGEAKSWNWNFASGEALSDARVHILNTDAFHWLQQGGETFDVVIVDFPDPTNFAIGKLFTNSFYALLDKRLAASGYAVVQTTSPLIARRSYWTVVQTIESIGLQATPYHAHVPSFGEWGFVIASHRPWREPDALPAGLRFLSAQTMALMFDFPLDMARVPAEVNRLSNQVLVNTYEREWGRVER